MHTTQYQIAIGISLRIGRNAFSTATKFGGEEGGEERGVRYKAL